MDDLSGKFIIRKAVGEDLKYIKEIESESNLSPWSENDYIGELARLDSFFLVCEIDKKVTGFLLARLIMISSFNNVDMLDLENKENIKFDLEIYNIGVRKEHRRLNIGSALMSKLLFAGDEKFAEGKKVSVFNSVFLEVRTSNTAAIDFYKSFNYKIVYTRKNLYANPSEDGYVMRFDPDNPET